VIGYISAGEDSELRKGDGQGPGGYDSCYFDKNHRNLPDKNGTWNSYYANPASKSWTDYFLKEAQQMEDRYGVDGFFLDTVETAVVYPESRGGMVNLIRKLRAAHPNAVIVLNRGFDVIADTGDIVDGLMYESFTLSYDQATKSYILMRPSALDFTRRQMEATLKPQQKAHGLVVLALDYAASADDPNIRTAYDRAATLGVIPCVTDIYLDAVFDVAYRGRPDPKWNSDFETAANRSYTLPAAVNGFPAGTVVTPSSNYADYSVAPIVDGLQDKSKVGWRDRAWASAEASETHSLEFHFPQPVTLHRLSIDWNNEGGTAYISHQIRVETQAQPQPAAAASWWQSLKTAIFGGAAAAHPQPAAWHSAWSTDNNTASSTVADLEATPITALRIEQPSGGGSTARPTVMWVQEVRGE
jgi:hypothetical protein